MSSTLTQFSVLMVEDNKADIVQFQDMMIGAVFDGEYPQVTVGICHTLNEAKIAIRKGRFDLILLDVNLPDAEHLEGLKFLIEEFPDMPIVLHTGVCSAKLASEAIAMGAQDCIPKGLLDKDNFIRLLVHAKMRQDGLRRLHSLSNRSI